MGTGIGLGLVVLCFWEFSGLFSGLGSERIFVFFFFLSGGYEE